MRKAKFDQMKAEHEQKVKTTKEKIKNASGEELRKLKSQMEELDRETLKLKDEEEKFKKEEKKQPWNVDTISKPGFAKTIINKQQARPKYEELSEEEKEKKMKEFVKENEKLLKQYGMLRKYDDSKRFLQEHHALVCEDTANYLVIWCINLEMEQKSELMSHVAHQCIAMQYILELSKQLDVDPRACVGSFFTKIQVAEIEYKKQFDSEVEAFIDRIKKRAEEKIQEAIAEHEEQERQERLGPGGLDPVEVFESLPKILQDCFESRDKDALKDALTKLPQEEMEYHMKRCIDSGLWIPDAAAAAELDPPKYAE